MTSVSKSLFTCVFYIYLNISLTTLAPVEELGRMSSFKRLDEGVPGTGLSESNTEKPVFVDDLLLDEKKQEDTEFAKRTEEEDTDPLSYFPDDFAWLNGNRSFSAYDEYEEDYYDDEEDDQWSCWTKNGDETENEAVADAPTYVSEVKTEPWTKRKDQNESSEAENFGSASEVLEEDFESVMMRSLLSKQKTRVETNKSETNIGAAQKKESQRRREKSQDDSKKRQRPPSGRKGSNNNNNGNNGNQESGDRSETKQGEASKKAQPPRRSPGGNNHKRGHFEGLETGSGLRSSNMDYFETQPEDAFHK